MTPILSFRYTNGDKKSRLIPVSFTPEIQSLDQVSMSLPEGAYTTFRTYPGLSALQLEDHFHRLEESASLAGHPIALDTGQLRENIRLALQQYPAESARVRVMIPFSGGSQSVYIFIGALTVPTAVKRAQGVTVISRKLHRPQPNAKLTGFITSTHELRKNLTGGIEEVIMVDEDGCVLEGLTSNFFAVIEGIIHTAGEGVLPGITRQIVLDIAQRESIAISFTAPYLTDIHDFDEAFITSTSRGVLPVTMIDSHPIGSGLPGKITRTLMDRYDQKVLKEVQPI